MGYALREKFGRLFWDSGNSPATQVRSIPCSNEPGRMSFKTTCPRGATLREKNDGYLRFSGFATDLVPSLTQTVGSECRDEAAQWQDRPFMETSAGGSRLGRRKELTDLKATLWRAASAPWNAVVRLSRDTTAYV